MPKRRAAREPEALVFLMSMGAFDMNSFLAPCWFCLGTGGLGPAPSTADSWEASHGALDHGLHCIEESKQPAELNRMGKVYPLHACNWKTLGEKVCSLPKHVNFFNE